MNGEKWSTIIHLRNGDNKIYLTFSAPIHGGTDYDKSPIFKEVVVSRGVAWDASLVELLPERSFCVDIDLETIFGVCGGVRKDVPLSLLWFFYNECLGNLSHRGLLPLDLGSSSYKELSRVWDSIMRVNVTKWIEEKLSNLEIMERQKKVAESVLIKPSQILLDYICNSNELLSSLLMLDGRELDVTPPYCLVSDISYYSI